jgi:uncharacterized membrane protein
MTIKVLYAGDTQVNHITSMKGMDSWSYAYYSDSSRYLGNALRDSPDIECDHIPGSDAVASLPSSVEDLEKYDCLILSDLGYNNIVFQPGNIPPFRIPMGPDRVSAIYEYVHGGGGLMMIGGWLSFSGLQGKGLYGGTKIEEILPVTCEPRGADDRIEVTQGFNLHLNRPEHPILSGLPWEEPYLFLGYNKVHLKPDSDLVASYDGDPIIATCQVGRGQSIVFTSDVGPHWAGSFLEWSGYTEFWQRMAKWGAGAL